MNSKEKAEELVEKYLRIEDNTTFYWDAYYDRRLFDEQVLYHAKKCALTAVDEISKHCYEVMKPFWEEVKTELKKL